MGKSTEWVVRCMVVSDEEIAATEFASLDDDDKEALRSSGDPDRVDMASDDPAVSDAAARRVTRRMFKKPCSGCGSCPCHHRADCRSLSRGQI